MREELPSSTLNQVLTDLVEDGYKNEDIGRMITYGLMYQNTDILTFGTLHTQDPRNIQRIAMKKLIDYLQTVYLGLSDYDSEQDLLLEDISDTYSGDKRGLLGTITRVLDSRDEEEKEVFSLIGSAFVTVAERYQKRSGMDSNYKLFKEYRELQQNMVSLIQTEET